jgi:hypothetical protein
MRCSSATVTSTSNVPIDRGERLAHQLLDLRASHVATLARFGRTPRDVGGLCLPRHEREQSDHRRNHPSPSHHPRILRPTSTAPR